MSTEDFMRAVASGNAEEVRTRLEASPSLAGTTDEGGRSALLLAAYHRHRDVVTAIRERLGRISLFEAAALGETERIREVVGVDPESVHHLSPDGFGALGLAAFFGHADVVEVLLDSGSDPDRPSENEMRVTPLHCAVANPDALISHAVASLLLEAGADPNVRQSGGWTPIHSAAAHGRMELTRLLLSHGAEAGVASDDGKTPAMLAEENGHSEIAGALAPLEESGSETA